MVDNPAGIGAGALISTLLIQALKNSPFVPFLTRQTATINFIVSLIAAMVTAGIVHYTWDGTQLTLVVTPHMLWGFVLQWVTQHAAYKSIVVPAETMGDIRSLLQRALQPPINPAEQKTQDAKP